MRSILTFLLMTITMACLWCQHAFDAFSFGDLRARSIGPAVMSGRISDVCGLDADPSVIYIGAANGGVWKSNNAGAFFSPIFDDHSLSIGAIAVDQSTPDTLWVGTGESWVRNSVSVGTGLYVSEDGGKTWSSKGLEKTERIANVVIHPQQSAIVYVAAQGGLWHGNPERGVYKTEDFGQSWKKVLYIDDNTGCADLCMDPTNPETLYACMWEHRRSADFFISGGNGSGLYKSTDGGQNWIKLSAGLPEGPLGRMAVAVAPSNPKRIYLTVEAKDKKDRGLYVSHDAGENWELINQDFQMTVRPFYFSRLVVDPNNPDKLYKAGTQLAVSNNGGKSFRKVLSQVHPDVHDIWVNPDNSDYVIIGTDGGGYRSLDGAYTFEMFDNLPLSQFYHVSVDDAQPYNIYGGLQDNGSWYGPSEAPGGVKNADWKVLHWGDGFRVYPHPTDSHIIYAESQKGELVRIDNHTGQRQNINLLSLSNQTAYRFNWNTPIQISPTHPERLYYGAQYLFLSNDRGMNWEKISPDLTTNEEKRQRQSHSGGLSIDHTGAENNTTIYCIAESPCNDQVIWVGTDDGHLQLTQNGGKTWTNLIQNVPNLPSGLWISHVEASRFNPATCYITIDGHRSGDQRTYLFKTTDFGQTWASLSTPEVEGYAHVVIEDTEQANLLFLGTEFGLFITLDGGISWKRFNGGIPRKISVRMMAIQNRESALVIATHGRGIFILDNLELLRALSPEVLNKEVHFFANQSGTIKYSRLAPPFGGAGAFVGENPSEHPCITYYMPKRHIFGKIKLEVFDQNGQFVKTLLPGKSAGINLVPFPIRYPAPKSAPSRNKVALGGSLTPPFLADGTYTIRLTKGKSSYETTFQLQTDKALNYDADDIMLRHKAQMDLYQMTEEVAYIYYNLEHFDQELQLRIAQIDDPKIKAPLAKMQQDINQLQQSLAALEGDFYIDTHSMLNEEIASLALQLSYYGGKPTAIQLEKLKHLQLEVKKANDRYTEITASLPDFNLALSQLNLADIRLPSFAVFKGNE